MHPSPLAGSIPLTAAAALALAAGLTPQARAQGSSDALPAITVHATPQGSPLGYLERTEAVGALGNKPILDTPFSISVVDSEDITARGAKSIGQIFFNDPAVYTPASSSTTDWWGTQIRGLGVRNNYIDDIPILLYWGGDFPTEAVESVTALKGLAGFMYGFGEPGGALSYQLKRPTPTNETVVNAGYRNPALFNLHLDTNYRIADDLGLRVNLATEQGEAYNAAEINRTVASVALDKNFGASVKWFTTVVYEESRIKNEPFQFYFDGYDAVGSGGKLPDVTYDYDDINVDNTSYDTKTLIASTGVQWRIDDSWNLKYQLGYSRKEHLSNKSFVYLLDQAGNYDGYMYNFSGQLDNLFTQLMLQGTVATGSVRHELVGGLGWQNSKDRWGQDFDFRQAFSGNIHQEQTFRADDMPDMPFEPATSETQQLYAFLSDTIHFNQHWQAIVGVRYTEYDLKDIDDDPSEDTSYSTSKASPTLALIYKPDAQTSLYGSYVEALEPGVRVSPSYANVGEVLGATVSKQYEIGAKHDSGSIDYTAALFRIQRANQMDSLRNGLRYLTQDGMNVYDGVELSGSYQATKNLNVGLGAVYLDGRMEDVSPNNASLEGNTPANTSDWQAVANFQYRVPSIVGLKFQGGLRYYGATFINDDNTLKAPDRTVVNAGFSYDFTLQNTSMTVYGNVYNLFNQKYWATGGWSAGNVGEARNFALSLQARF